MQHLGNFAVDIEEEERKSGIAVFPSKNFLFINIETPLDLAADTIKRILAQHQLRVL